MLPVSAFLLFLSSYCSDMVESNYIFPEDKKQTSVDVTRAIQKQCSFRLSSWETWSWCNFLLCKSSCWAKRNLEPCMCII
ncbi:hypothetical protein XELAEV_18018976mg [Xenopus laevis]|uniref:Uncharacterized protein n=1 Tax=Xenopus laevis TaxID=8355 RepID=A0A974HU97_XENLA|nr:hypothetical protein XELAEV_18018976mg [Xenopus laevis]